MYLSCKLCPKYFQTNEQLEKHMLVRHGTMVPDDNDEKDILDNSESLIVRVQTYQRLLFKKGTSMEHLKVDKFGSCRTDKDESISKRTIDCCPNKRLRDRLSFLEGLLKVLYSEPNEAPDHEKDLKWNHNNNNNNNKLEIRKDATQRNVSTDMNLTPAQPDRKLDQISNSSEYDDNKSRDNLSNDVIEKLNDPDSGRLLVCGDPCRVCAESARALSQPLASKRLGIFSQQEEGMIANNGSSLRESCQHRIGGKRVDKGCWHCCNSSGGGCCCCGCACSSRLREFGGGSSDGGQLAWAGNFYHTMKSIKLKRQTTVGSDNKQSADQPSTLSGEQKRKPNPFNLNSGPHFDNQIEHSNEAADRPEKESGKEEEYEVKMEMELEKRKVELEENNGANCEWSGDKPSGAAPSVPDVSGLSSEQSISVSHQPLPAKEVSQEEEEKNEKEKEEEKKKARDGQELISGEPAVGGEHQELRPPLFGSDIDITPTTNLDSLDPEDEIAEAEAEAFGTVGEVSQPLESLKKPLGEWGSGFETNKKKKEEEEEKKRGVCDDFQNVEQMASNSKHESSVSSEECFSKCLPAQLEKQQNVPEAGLQEWPDSDKSISPKLAAQQQQQKEEEEEEEGSEEVKEKRLVDELGWQSRIEASKSEHVVVAPTNASSLVGGLEERFSSSDDDDEVESVLELADNESHQRESNAGQQPMKGEGGGEEDNALASGVWHRKEDFLAIESNSSLALSEDHDHHQNGSSSTDLTAHTKQTTRPPPPPSSSGGRRRSLELDDDGVCQLPEELEHQSGNLSAANSSITYTDEEKEHEKKQQAAANFAPALTLEDEGPNSSTELSLTKEVAHANQHPQLKTTHTTKPARILKSILKLNGANKALEQKSASFIQFQQRSSIGGEGVDLIDAQVDSDHESELHLAAARRRSSIVRFSDERLVRVLSPIQTIERVQDYDSNKEA